MGIMENRECGIPFLGRRKVRTWDRSGPRPVCGGFVRCGAYPASYDDGPDAILLGSEGGFVKAGWVLCEPMA